VIDMSRPRRSPRADERKRDPERTQERILEAAVIEFGEHGYAGARISAIADRAGVNQQLISYYFNGKQGLYQALSQRWQAMSAHSNAPDMPLADVVANFLEIGVTQRSWARLLAWQGLTGDGGDNEETDRFFASMVDDIRRRQQAGELADDLDPAYTLLMLFMAAMAPTLLPQVVRRITGQAADAPEFLAAYSEQLKRALDHLAG
jgi:TetR/AcrR family transcriptional regulator